MRAYAKIAEAVEEGTFMEKRLLDALYFDSTESSKFKHIQVMDEQHQTVTQKVHIGSLIKAELERQERSVSWFARKLSCDRSNVYKIYKRTTIDTELLLRISNILQYNFFDIYQEQVNSSCVEK